MRLAIARGVLWCFGSIIFMILFFGEKMKGTTTEQYLGLLFVGIMVGGVVFSHTWYNYEQQERDLKLEERRKALKSKVGE